MAILNVKNFPDDLYRELRQRARREHRSVAQEVIHLLSGVVVEEPISLLALRGLGKEVWKDVDASEHVRRERRSWD